MDEGSQYKLKISIDNTTSDNEDSDSGSDDFKHNRRPKTLSGNNSVDEVFKERESDNDGTVLSVTLDTDRPKVPEPRIRSYMNTAGTFVMGFDPTSEECRERQEQRAKRFGDAVSGNPLTDESIRKLYESLGVSPTSDKEDGSITRFDAIHIHGVDEMSTSRVFDYFREFAPSAIEWIDDISCNVVWMDQIVAARAMLKMSTEPSTSTDNGADSTANEIQKDSIDAVSEAQPESAVSAKEPEEAKSMEEDDDDLNLLSDDDVAKLSHSTITAEENRAEIEKRRSSVAEDRSLAASNAKSVDAVQEEEEDMEVDDDVKRPTASRVAKQPELSHPDRQSSVALETDPSADNPKRMERVRTREKPLEMPPGKWRIGVPDPRTQRLYMRFATKDDVKQHGAGKRSKYYLKYGNPNFGGMKGIISESRKRKMFSRKYHDELEEARRAIEEAKWKRGVPDETKFDQHVEAVLKRPKVTRKREELDSPSVESDDDSSNALVVEPYEEEEARPPVVKKRFMRMHADEEEEQSRSLSDRLGARNHSRSSSNVRDRLGFTAESSHGSTDQSDSHRRSGRREISGDLRSRLSRR